jgi:hypothetical protein
MFDQYQGHHTAPERPLGASGDNVSRLDIQGAERADASPGIMVTMPDEHLMPSYAPPARRRGYIKAMREVADCRTPGRPVRVYISAPPDIRANGGWDDRLRHVRKLLPNGVELLAYDDVFPRGTDYYETWSQFAAQLDGLVVVAKRKKPAKYVYRLGPVARNELKMFVAAAKPVLLLAKGMGLVPVVDCRPQRIGPPGAERLKLAVPRAWSRAEPTLHAALTALRPAKEDIQARAFSATCPVTAPPTHIATPFAQPVPCYH